MFVYYTYPPLGENVWFPEQLFFSASQREFESVCWLAQHEKIKYNMLLKHQVKNIRKSKAFFLLFGFFVEPRVNSHWSAALCFLQNTARVQNVVKHLHGCYLINWWFFSSEVFLSSQSFLLCSCHLVKKFHLMKPKASAVVRLGRQPALGIEGVKKESRQKWRKDTKNANLEEVEE